MMRRTGSSPEPIQAKGAVRCPYPRPTRRRATSATGGEVSARTRTADTEPDVVQASGGSVDYLATARRRAASSGSIAGTSRANRSGPDPHFHRTISESFFVLSGTVSLYDGLAWKDAGPGDFMYVPAGGIHGFKNESGEPASMLLLFAPGRAARGVLRDARGHRPRQGADRGRAGRPLRPPRQRLALTVATRAATMQGRVTSDGSCIIAGRRPARPTSVVGRALDAEVGRLGLDLRGDLGQLGRSALAAAGQLVAELLQLGAAGHHLGQLVAADLALGEVTQRPPRLSSTNRSPTG